jgi:hypothetical protein
VNAEVAALRLPQAGESWPRSRQPHASLLAELLVEFDPLLAWEVREHLEARADEWDEAARRIPSTRAVRAARYRALAELISLGSTPSAPAGS